MEENKKGKIKYLIPPNVASRFEFWEGFGFKELYKVLVALGIGLIIFIALGIPQKEVFVYNMRVLPIEEIPQGAEYTTKFVPVISSFLRIIPLVVLSVGMFSFVTKNPLTGLSLQDMLINRRAFFKKQKRYFYKYNSGEFL